MDNIKYIQTDSFEVLYFEVFEKCQKFLVIEFIEQECTGDEAIPDDWTDLQKVYETDRGDPVTKLDENVYEIWIKSKPLLAIRV